MASAYAFSVSKTHSRYLPSPYPSSALSPVQFQFQFQFPGVNFQNRPKSSAISCISSVPKYNKHKFLRPTKLRALTEEEETLVPEQESSSPTTAEAIADDQTVSVSVSPSDVLTMFFQAEGAMTDSAVPAVTKALKLILDRKLKGRYVLWYDHLSLEKCMQKGEEVEGITDLKVQVIEGIASVELTKHTTVQATGVASNLVEIIQGSGFKLQTLNLSFQDEEDIS